MPSDNPYQLDGAKLHWSESGAPLSGTYDDIYFSRENGLAETDWVFLRGNRLAERWRALDPERPGLFVIGETGFGTGLNFLCAWQLWRELAPRNWRLLFISAEKFPLARADLERALAQWPQFAPLCAELLDVYPARIKGFHHATLSHNTQVQWLFDAADSAFDALLDSAAPELGNGFAVDAWFLDGFAPAKNPEMWTAQLFDSIGRLSRPGSSFATFTAAGFVRRGLNAEGFDAQKTPGFGSKREMLSGVFQGVDEAANNDVAPVRPRHQTRAVDYWAKPPRALPKQNVIVIGGGLAGTSTARALAERGWPVTLLERGEKLANAASGNPQGVLYTKLSTQGGALNRFALASYLHALSHYRQRAVFDQDCGDFCGVLQLEDNGQWRSLAQTFADQAEWVQFVDAAGASALSGCTVSQPALWFPRAGWLSPPRVCAQLARHPLIDIRLNCDVQGLQRDGDSWLLRTSTGALRASCVVLANAHAAAQLRPDAELPLKSIRGQISFIPRQPLREQPRSVICHEGYLTPDCDGGIAIGATFDLRDNETQVRETDHQRNITALKQALPNVLDASAQIPELQGRVGFRCATPDYLPLAGALSDHALLRERCAVLAHNARARIEAPNATLPGLYLNVGHGSRGLTSTPICAELIAAQIAGEPRPLPRDLAQALSPDRFAIRNLIRGR